MGLVQLLSFVTLILFLAYLFFRVIFSCWILPVITYQKLTRSGFKGPTPKFPLGNISEMKKKKNKDSSSSSVESTNTIISHDIHSAAFPYFAQWQQSHGKSATIPLYFNYLCDNKLLIR